MAKNIDENKNEFVIRIKVEKEKVEEDNLEENEKGDDRAPKRRASTTQGAKYAQQVASTAMNIAKSLINEQIEISGNTQLSKSWDNFSAIASPLLTIGMGFAMGGVMGAVVAGGIATAQIITNEYRQGNQVKKANYTIDYAYRATGNASTMGSRYTYD